VGTHLNKPETTWSSRAEGCVARDFAHSILDTAQLRHRRCIEADRPCNAVLRLTTPECRRPYCPTGLPTRCLSDRFAVACTRIQDAL